MSICLDVDLLEIIINSEDSSDSEHHESDFNEGSRNLSSHSNNVFALAVAFFMMFRVIYNIPDHAVVLLLQIHTINSWRSITNFSIGNSRKFPTVYPGMLFIY